MKILYACFVLVLFSTTSHSQSIVATLEKTFKGINTIEIEGKYCNVEVTGASASDIHFKGEIRSSNHYFLNINHSVSGSTLKIWVDQPKSNPGNTTGKLIFRVPARTTLKINNSIGHAVVQGMTGKAHNITTTLGNITARNVAANLTTKTVSGSIVVSGLRGNLELNSKLGDHRFRDVTGVINALAGNGSISANGIRGNITTKTLRGYQRINNTNGQVNIESKEGDLSLNTVNGNVKAKSETGSIQIDQVTGAINLTSVTGNQSGKGNRLTGESSFISSSGNIHVQLNNAREGLSFFLSATSGHLKAKGTIGRRTLVIDNGGIKVTGKSGAGSQTYY